MMKEKTFAVYLGKEYEAYRSGRITLYSTDIEDVSKGFELCKAKDSETEFVCIKTVEKSEVTSYYYKRTLAIYKGYTFGILEEKEDMLSIVAGNYRVCQDMEMNILEKGVYQKWIKKEEAEFILEIEGDSDNDVMKTIWQLLNLETKEMKTGTFAIYSDKTYIITTDEKGNILLHSTDLGDISKGFEACKSFQILGIKKDIVCTKYVELSELDYYFKVKTKARYGSDEIDIIEEKEKMLSIMGIDYTFKAVRENNDFTIVIEKEIPYQKWVTKEKLRGIRLEIEELANNQEIQNIWRLLNIDIENKKHNTYVAYLGKAYAADTTLDGNFVLYSTNSGDISMGFEQCKPFKIEGGKKDITHVKYVKPSEVSSYFKVRIVAEYQGYELEVVEEKEKMLSVVTIYENGRMKGDKVWEGIGMVPVDKYKNVYQKWIRKEEAKKIKYEIKELLNNVKMEKKK